MTANSSTATVVATSFGALRGSVDERGVRVFKGIPFAAPPVGDLRFRPPVPPAAWAGERDATAFGNASVQAAAGMFGAQEVERSEDCLYLNVWAPGAAAGAVNGGAEDGAGSGPLRPVMVWIHGGAFRMGSGSSPGYDGANLVVDGDVVVVTINYRLGLLGFLHAPEIGAANLGLQDQIAALRWVHDEIAAFGGDPDQVTIFGESAGGKSVECLLAMPAAKGLFRRAIVESTYDPPTDAAPATVRTNRIVEHLGLRSPEELRTVELDQLLAAENAVSVVAGALAGGAGPVVDGDTLPAAPIDVVRAGQHNAREVVVGTTLDECRLFGAMAGGNETIDHDGLVSRMAGMLGAADGDTVERAIEHYRKDLAGFGEADSPADVWAMVQTDRMFRQHSIRLAEALADQSPSTWMYLFTWKATGMGGKLGACHAIELPFVFGTLDVGLGMLAGGATPESRSLSDVVRRHWLAFARTGDPGPAWPAYDADRRATRVLGAEVRTDDAPLDAIRTVWSS